MKSCLVVDDSATIRALVKVHLMGMGLAFHEAVDGNEGLKMAQQVRPNIIIADLQMPTLDGIAFVKALRALEDKGLSDVPVILLTAAKESKTSGEARQAGVNHFMRKPIDGAALQKAVKNILDHRS